MTIISIIEFLAGLGLVIKGADWLTDGASEVAKKYKVSTLIIGLTIVAFGTSLPELVVSSLSALKGSSDMAMGNVIGSNLFNTLAIVGVTAMFCPIYCKKDLLKRDIPVNIIVTGLLLILVFLIGESWTISRWEGMAMLLLFGIYIGYTIYSSIKTQNVDNSTSTEENQEVSVTPLWKSIVLIVIGLIGLVVGGQWFVNGASDIALMIGVSEAVVALTIVAAGTSFPELATSIMAAKKGDTDMAMGNVIGSNIFNIMLILGTSAVVSPINTQNISTTDFAILMASIIVLTLMVLTNKEHRLGKACGTILTLMMIAYYVILVYNV